MPILQINFKLNVLPAEYKTLCQSLAQTFADLPGLRWKVWLLNEQENEAGGIYLFSSEQALHDYLSGPIVAQLKSHPGVRDISAKRFEVMEDVTAVTRGPVRVGAATQSG
jgi:Putative mono-oxygenase ydhR